MTAELQGKSVNGWLVQDYIDCGKSALVLKAEKAGQLGAIKIFDRELIERFGRDVQAERIKRETGLVGKKHPHLIEIFDGGYAADLDVHYIVMNFFAGTNLAKVRDKMPADKIRLLISQVAAAAQFLESIGLAHRDIKPENIGIDVELKHAVLLDLGVVRPMGIDPVTDHESTRVFIGTLQYSSPEFLLREEIDSVEGWRAVTFYQLGGVLHDLITGKPLFQEESAPFARLSNAVQHKTPLIESATVPVDLVELAKNCLVKPAALRLRLVNWSNFDPIPSPAPAVEEMKKRIEQRRLRDALGNTSQATPDRSTLAWKINEYATKILSIFRRECIGNPSFPPLSVSDATAVAEHCTRFGLAFEPSAAHALRVHLHLSLQLRWLDITEDVVAIEVGAAIGPTPLCGTDAAAITLQPVYQGKFSQESIGSALTGFLYHAFDQAQSIDGEISSATMLNLNRIREITI